VTKVRLLSRLVGALLITIGISVGFAGSASAHDVLISSNPADNATVQVAPTTVSFTFDQPIQNFDPVVSLVGPDGKQYATGSPQISGNVITGTVGVGPAGTYTAAYRIVSADGHPVTGQIHFTLAGDEGVPASGVAVSDSASGPPGSGTTTAGAQPSGGAESTTTSAASAGPTSGTVAAGPAAGSSGGLSAWLWIGLIVAALVIVTAGGLLWRRPARDRDSDY
jgi:hypothetical protein